MEHPTTSKSKKRPYEKPTFHFITYDQLAASEQGRSLMMREEFAPYLPENVKKAQIDSVPCTNKYPQ